MFEVSREVQFCFGHRLLHYDGKCRQLHGHNGRALFTVASDSLDELGMAIDFSMVKQVCRDWINDHVDHLSLLAKGDPLIPRLREMGEPFVELEVNPTTEVLARLLFQIAHEHQIPVQSVQVWENDASAVRYSQSLNCSSIPLHWQAMPRTNGVPLEPILDRSDDLDGSHWDSPISAPFQVRREMKFCFGHRLQDYHGKCRNLHGHNARAVLTVESDLDPLGMAVDFTQIKRKIQTWIDQHLDHAMILRQDDPLIDVLREVDCPVFTLPVNPTTENLAKLLFDHAHDEGLPVVEVMLWETASSGASYSPSGNRSWGEPAAPARARND